MEKTDLKEAFSRQYASCKVHTIQTSKLWKHLKGKSRKRTLQVYIFPVSDINCCVKDGRSLLASLQAVLFLYLCNVSISFFGNLTLLKLNGLLKAINFILV